MLCMYSCSNVRWHAMEHQHSLADVLSGAIGWRKSCEQITNLPWKLKYAHSLKEIRKILLGCFLINDLLYQIHISWKVCLSINHGRFENLNFWLISLNSRPKRTSGCRNLSFEIFLLAWILGSKEEILEFLFEVMINMSNFKNSKTAITFPIDGVCFPHSRHHNSQISKKTLVNIKGCDF